MIRTKEYSLPPTTITLLLKNSLNAIGFKQGIDFYPTEQFDLKFNRPDIVLERLAVIPIQDWIKKRTGTPTKRG
ncbi:MAG: hypothetical protein MZV63_28915 [Marinilabiliales bacterium]|nr:hypothetical protein [Marinilabiliales bacterium]